MPKQREMLKIGPLEALEAPGQPGGPTIICLHGYGASAYDLYPLHHEMQAPPGTRWIFPNGHLKVPIGMHVYGRAWFPIDIEALEQAQKMGTHRDLSVTTPPGVKDAREKIQELIAELKIPFSQTILMGFSQGAMLATSITLYAKENPKGLVLMSGALLDGKNWAEKAKAHAGLTFYQSHGEHDEILSIQGGRQLEKVLQDGGLKGKLQTFSGGHDIPLEVLHGASNYLKGLFRQH